MELYETSSDEIHLWDNYKWVWMLLVEPIFAIKIVSFMEPSSYIPFRQTCKMALWLVKQFTNIPTRLQLKSSDNYNTLMTIFKTFKPFPFPVCFIVDNTVGIHPFYWLQFGWKYTPQFIEIEWTDSKPEIWYKVFYRNTYHIQHMRIIFKGPILLDHKMCNFLRDCFDGGGKLKKKIQDMTLSLNHNLYTEPINVNELVKMVRVYLPTFIVKNITINII